MLELKEIENNVKSLNWANDFVIEFVIKQIMIFKNVTLIVPQNQSCQEVVVELDEGYDEVEILEFLIGGFNKFLFVLVPNFIF